MRKLKIQINNNRRNLLYIIVLWLLSAVIINPLGEFPLNDDWAYALDVYNLSHGIFKLSDWPAMNLIAQTLWGAAISLIFGFSFTALRLSVLFLAIIGSIIFYKLLRKIIEDEGVYLLFTAVFIFNPLYFSLSFSFMTDVTFLMLLITSFYYYTKYFSNNSLKSIYVATIFALLATMIRQLGIYIGIAALVTYLITCKIKSKHLAIFLLTAIIPIAVSGIYNFILEWFNLQRAGHLGFYDAFITIKTGEFFKSFSNRYSTILFFYGITLLPASALLFPSYWNSTKKVKKWFILVISIILSLFIIPHLNQILTGNVFYNLGLGPKTLKDTYSGFNISPRLTSTYLITFHIIGIAGAILLLFILISSIIMLKIKSIMALHKFKILALIVIVGYLGFLFIDINFFDRYFLMLVPFIIILVIPAKFHRKDLFSNFALISLIIYACFSIIATHDYFSWNKARWSAINDLLKQGVSPRNIDGGFEFNGWYATDTKKRSVSNDKSWWFVYDDTYVISFGNYCGYKPMASYRYNNFLNISKDSIYILKKTEKDTISISTDFEKISAEKNFYLTSDTGLFINYNDFNKSSIVHSGKNSVMLDNMHQFGIDMNLREVLPCEIIKIKFWNKNTNSKAGVVFTHKNGKIFYYCAEIKNNNKDVWQYSEVEAQVPADYPSHEIIIYFWSINGGKIYIDDLVIQRIKEKK